MKGKKCNKKYEKIYLPYDNYKDLMIVELYKGKPKSIKFKNEFIDWIEKEISTSSNQRALF